MHSRHFPRPFRVEMGISGRRLRRVKIHSERTRAFRVRVNVEFLVFMRSSSGARFYVTCAKGPAELGRRLPACPGPRRERRGFSLCPLSTSQQQFARAQAMSQLRNQRTSAGAKSMGHRSICEARTSRKPCIFVRTGRARSLEATCRRQESIRPCRTSRPKGSAS